MIQCTCFVLDHASTQGIDANMRDVGSEQRSLGVDRCEMDNWLQEDV